jgi:hypothetical protein
MKTSGLPGPGLVQANFTLGPSAAVAGRSVAAEVADEQLCAVLPARRASRSAWRSGAVVRNGGFVISSRKWPGKASHAVHQSGPTIWCRACRAEGEGSLLGLGRHGGVQAPPPARLVEQVFAPG